MRRRLFTFLSIVSLLLCVATCVLWVRSYSTDTQAGWVTGTGDRYRLISSAGRITMFGPPQAQSDIATAVMVSQLRNEQVEFTAMLQNDVRVGEDYPAYMCFPDNVTLDRATVAYTLDGPKMGPGTIRALLAALDRPEAFVAAHVLLTRQFYVPDGRYSHGTGIWTWEADHSQFSWLRGRDPPPRGPVSGDFRGLRMEARLPTEDPSFSGGMPFPCLVRIDPAQLPAIRDQWHRRLDIPVHSAPWWSMMATTALLPTWWIVVSVSRTLRHRSCRASNHCPSCGYDLRASPKRCPECGAEAASAGIMSTDAPPPVHTSVGPVAAGVRGDVRAVGAGLRLG